MISNQHQVVITGMGIVSSLGNNIQDFSHNLFSGVSGIKGISSFDANNFNCQLGAEISNIDFTQYVKKKELILYDRLSLLTIAAADQAIANAGIELDKDRSSLGVILGSGLGPSSSIEEMVTKVNNHQRLRPTSLLKIMLNSPGAALCARYRCQELSAVHVTACAASSHALAQAANAIRQGDIDICISGGADAFPSRALFSAWDALNVMTTNNALGKQAVRPFDQNRSGLVIGEGAGILVLESKQRALKRGAKIYAELKGFGISSDAPSLTMPSITGMASAMSKALTSAEVNAQAIQYINAHGTATAINDKLETQAIKDVFQDHSKDLQISSTKAAHGHAMGASGAIESIATILALQKNLAPPTLNLEQGDPECDLNYTPNTALKMRANMAMSNSFAFGGHYVSLLFSATE
ncbi:MAG: 3-oxoacyl-[acyl-carrier-protein] synthase II [Colwellia sp.]|jgi:3-oxoacyl-[acyl-carrier-protein] synthase II